MTEPEDAFESGLAPLVFKGTAELPPRKHRPAFHRGPGAYLASMGAAELDPR
jgi:hypothetical protein